MSANGEINNTLKLDVSQFDRAIQKVSKKLEKFNKDLAKTDTSIGSLERGLERLGGNVKTLSSQFKLLNTSFMNTIKGLSGIKQGSDATSKSLNGVEKSISKVATSASQSAKSLDVLSNSTKNYEKNLKAIPTLLDKISKGQSDLESKTKSLGGELDKLSQRAISNNSRALQSEVQTNNKIIAEKKAMVNRLAQLQKNAEANLANQQQIYNGKFFGKNKNSMSDKAVDMRQNIDMWKREVEAAKNAKKQAESFLRSMQSQSYSSSGARGSRAANQPQPRVSSLREQQTYSVNNTTRSIKSQRQQYNLPSGILGAASVDISGRQQSLRFLPQLLPNLQQVSQQQQQNHRQQMQNLQQEQQQQQEMHKQQIDSVKEMALAFASATMQVAAIAAINQNMNLEQSKLRLNFWNLPKDERERFIGKSKDLTKSERYLTQSDAIDARLAAVSMLGKNKEDVVDKTLPNATRIIQTLRSAGYESGSNNELLQGLYGFADATKALENPEKIKKAFEAIYKISTISNGKIKVADVETAARSMGGMSSNVSEDGWVGVFALAEQMKSASGEESVARMSAMLKMMGLYTSGAPITNENASAQMGTDVLAEFKDGDVTKAAKENAQNTQNFIKMLKSAGFTDSKAMGDDPVKFFASMREQILSYMMRKDNFASFFGENTKRWSYDTQGQMLDQSGKVVDRNEQARLEQIGFRQYGQGLGWSNGAVDSLASVTDIRSLDKASQVTTSAKQAVDSSQAYLLSQQTLQAAIENSKASLGRLAEAFEPLLGVVTGFVSIFTQVVDAVTSIINIDPSIAYIVGLGAALGGVTLASIQLFGQFSTLRTFLSGAMSSLGLFSSTAAQTGTAISGVGAAAGTVGPQVATMSSRVLGIMGGLLRWTGWVGLALIVGQVFISWLDSINKNETPLQTGFQRFVQGWKNSLASGLNEMGVWFNEFLLKMGWDIDRARANLDRLRKEKGEVLTIPVKGLSKEEGGGFTSTPETLATGIAITKAIKDRDSAEKTIKSTARAPDLILARARKKEAEIQLKEYRDQLKKNGQVFVESGPYAGTVVYKSEIESNSKLLKDKQGSKKAPPPTNNNISNFIPSKISFPTGNMNVPLPSGDKVQNATPVAEDPKRFEKYGAEQSNAAYEGFTNAFNKLLEGHYKKSESLAALEQQFARYEKDNPKALEDSAYLAKKNSTINYQVAQDTVALATGSKSTSQQLAIGLMDSNVGRRKANADFAYNEVEREINSQRKALDERIKLVQANIGKAPNAQKEYDDLIKAKLNTEAEFTNRLILEHQKRVKDSESATQQMLRQYQNLQDGMENLNQKWSEKSMDSVSNLITGRMKFKDLDWRQIGSDIFADYSKVFVQSAMSQLVIKAQDTTSNLLKNVMGDQTFSSLGTSLLQGKAADGTGWVSEMLNKFRNLGPFKPAVDPITGESTVAAGASEVLPLFNEFRTALIPLTTSLGTLWESIGTASSSLFSFATDAVAKAISALAQWALGLLTSQTAESGSSFLGTLFQVGSSVMGAYSGGGGAAGAIGSGASYQVGGGYGSAIGWGGTFAKGGTFTNNLFNRPTAFAFANGGSFSQLGVMGEAGPEAVMPLSRDSSGKLGVSLYSDSTGGSSQQNQVSIQVNINNEGSSSTTSNGDERGEYKDMARQIEAVVVSQLSKQSRPGGLLYKK